MVPSASISVASPLYAPNIPPWSLPFGPVIDGAVSGLVDDPLKLRQSGKSNRVPFILGDNEGDGTTFVPLLNNIVPGVHVSGRGTSRRWHDRAFGRNTCRQTSQNRRPSADRL